MTNRRPYIVAIVLVVALMAFVFIWQIAAVPGFNERERMIRGENAAFLKDIAEIEAMNGNTDELESKISDIEKSIAAKYSGRAVTIDDITDVINRICIDAGLPQAKIVLGGEQRLSPAGKHVPALYTAEITIMFDGLKEHGAALIRGLENKKTADVEITAFVFRADPPPIFEEDDEDDKKETYTEEDDAEEPIETSGEWLITARIFYYA